MKDKVKKEKIVYFTDDMAKSIYCFQDMYKQPKSGKPVLKTISLKPSKR